MNTCLDYDLRMGTYPESMFQGLALFEHFLDEYLIEDCHEEYLKAYRSALKHKYPDHFGPLDD